MKRKAFIVVLLFLFMSWPVPIIAGRAIPVVIEGDIGDYAPDARVYEIDGKIYRFQKDIVIQAEDGKILTFKDLKGGTRVRLIGESAFRGAPPDAIAFSKIIVIAKQPPKKPSQRITKGTSWVR